MPCIVFNFPINNFSQHLFAGARNCRGWCHDAHSDMGRCYQLVATLTLRGNTHTQIIPNPSQSSKHLISHDNCKKHLAFESQWVKWKQNWNFRTFKIRKVELLHHLRTLPIVPAMSVGDVCRQLPDSRSMMSVFLLFSKVRRSAQAVYNSSIIPHGGVHAGKNQASQTAKNKQWTSLSIAKNGSSTVCRRSNWHPVLK